MSKAPINFGRFELPKMIFIISETNKWGKNALSTTNNIMCTALNKEMKFVLSHRGAPTRNVVQ